MKISKIICVFLFSTNCFCFSFGGGSGVQPVIDYKAIAYQIKQYEQLYQQLEQQINMVNMAKANLKQLGKFSWESLSNIINQSNNIVNSVGALSYSTDDLANKFDNIYKQPESVRQEYINSSNEQRALNSYRYNKRINENLRKTSFATMQKLQESNKQLEKESKTIQKLKERSEGATGQLQATQATNDLLAYQIDELRKLRVAMMDQMAMLSNLIAAQSSKEQAREEKIREFYKNARNAGKSQTIIPGVSK